MWNILRIEPKVLLAAFLAFFVLLTSYVLHMQHSVPYSIFINSPKIAKQAYNYFKRKRTSENIITDDSINFNESKIARMSSMETDRDIGCLICQKDVKEDVFIDKYLFEEFPLWNRMRKKAIDYYMKTPCQHSFHIECLVFEMMYFLKCPACQQQLSLILLSK